MKKILIGILASLLFISSGNAEIAKQPLKENSSKRISLEIKDMEIVDILKLLSKESGINIISGRNVRGKVTLFLKDVDVWEVLKIIMDSNNLAYEKEGNIIKVMTDKEYEVRFGRKFYEETITKIVKIEHANALDISNGISQLNTKIGKVVVDERSNIVVIIDIPEKVAEIEKIIKEMDVESITEIFSLNYANTEDIKAKLDEIITKESGSVTIDTRTNKLIVKDTLSKMTDIKKVVEAFDERTKEVLIEAKIVQIELNEEFSLGVNWDSVFSGIGAASGMNFDVISGAIIPTTAASAVKGGAFSIGSLTDDNYAVLVEALERIGSTQILSSPRITVINNEEARIMVGTNQPFVTSTTTIPDTGSAVTSEEVTYIDVGVTLTVTPTINNDGFITMKIKPEVSSLGTPFTAVSTGNEFPVVSTSTAETSIMVKDGCTVVIGGLIKTRDEEETKKVPFLGDIPILGWAFKSTSRGSSSSPEREELVIFLTPTIIKGEEDSLEIAKYLDYYEVQMTRTKQESK